MRRIAFVFLLLVATTAFAQYDDTITVSRVVFDVRVTTASGDPITDLTPADFEVSLGGNRATVASATWTEEGANAEERPYVDENEPGVIRTRVEPRTIVLLVQTDFGRAAARVRGQMKFRTYAEELIQSFEPRDRVAVFSFDSHLKFRCDLSTDREENIEALRNTILIDEPPPPREVPAPSLASQLDRNAMKRAVNTEEALTLIGNALAHIDGPKTLLLLGWGLGDRWSRIVYMLDDWKEARKALLDARVSIVALNTSLTGGGALAHGMAMASKQTGGMYANAAGGPRRAVNRVQRTLHGRYELEIVPSKQLEPGEHSIAVRVNRRGANVLAPGSITISYAD